MEENALRYGRWAIQFCQETDGSSPPVNITLSKIYVLQDLGTAEPSMLSDLLQSNLSENKLDEVKWATSSVYGGGADTVRISSQSLRQKYH